MKEWVREVGTGFTAHKEDKDDNNDEEEEEE
jgi:hypothetical protein